MKLLVTLDFAVDILMSLGLIGQGSGWHVHDEMSQWGWDFSDWQSVSSTQPGSHCGMLGTKHERDEAIWKMCRSMMLSVCHSITVTNGNQYLSFDYIQVKTYSWVDPMVPLSNFGFHAPKSLTWSSVQNNMCLFLQIFCWNGKNNTITLEDFYEDATFYCWNNNLTLIIHTLSPSFPVWR